MMKIKVCPLVLFLLTLVTLHAHAAEVKQQPLAALGYTYYAIQTDGTLLAWGDSFHGATGREVDIPFSEANPVLKHTIYTTGNMNLGLAVDCEKVLWGWGWDWTGRLLGAENANMEPVRLMDHVISVTAGLQHCMALKDDGSVWIWGLNQYGQIGNGQQDQQDGQMHIHKPERVMDHVCAMTTDGDSASYAIKDDGTLWTWGRQSDDIAWLSPVQIMEHVEKAHWGCNPSGRRGILVLGHDGSLWFTSFDEENQWYTEPQQMIQNVVRFSNGCAITDNDELWCWGPTVPAYISNMESDMPVSIMTHVADAVSDNGCTLVIKTDGSLWELTSNLTVEGDSDHSMRMTSPIKLAENMMIPVHPTNTVSDSAKPTVVHNPIVKQAGQKGSGQPLCGVVISSIAFLFFAVVFQRRKGRP